VNHPWAKKKGEGFFFLEFLANMSMSNSEPAALGKKRPREADECVQRVRHIHADFLADLSYCPARARLVLNNLDTFVESMDRFAREHYKIRRITKMRESDMQRLFEDSVAAHLSNDYPSDQDLYDEGECELTDELDHVVRKWEDNVIHAEFDKVHDVVPL
jgi:hypothetical protein